MIMQGRNITLCLRLTQCNLVLILGLLRTGIADYVII